MNELTDNQISTYQFTDDGTIPNNPTYPLVIYKDILTSTDNPEQILAHNNWLGSWRGGIFNQHNYHSNTHEVLAVVTGEAFLQLGGASGKQLAVASGDVLILPAGTGHKLVDSSPDFTVVGAYPNGISYDFCTGQPQERPQNVDNIATVTLPAKDPLFGSQGPLFNYWQ